MKEILLYWVHNDTEWQQKIQMVQNHFQIFLNHLVKSTKIWRNLKTFFDTYTKEFQIIFGYFFELLVVFLEYMNCTDDVQIKSLEINSLKLKKCRYNKLFRGWGRSLYYTKIQTGNANEHSLTCWQDNTLCRPQANNFLTEKRTCSSKDNVSSRNKPAISIQDISEQKAETTWLNISNCF